MDSILLTGSQGYLGSRVAAALTFAGISFRSLDRRLESITPASLSCRTVIHCAGALRNNAEHMFATNAEGTHHLVRGLAQDARIVFVSTRSVYPRAGLRLVDERQAVDPADDYGASKLAAEECIRASGKDFVIFRASTLFGHPGRAGSFPDHALDQTLEGHPVQLARPDRDVDYLDVDVLAQLLVAASGNGDHWGQVLNVAGPPRSLGDMIHTLDRVLVAHAGRSATIDPTPMPLPDYPLLDTTRCRKLFPAVRQDLDDAIYARMLRGRRIAVAAERNPR